MKKEKKNKFNLFPNAERYGIPFWKSPQFLFLVMGIIIMATAIFSYLMGTRYLIEPELIVVFILSSTSLLFVIAYIVSRSIEELAESNMLKTEFVNVVSHQLRTPLSNLKWGLDTLYSEKEKTIKSQEEYLQILSENVERMKNLISELLIVAKIQQKRYVPAVEKVDMNEIVEKAVNGVKFYAKASNIKITVKSKANIPFIFVDPIQMRTVVDNLIDNAIKYTQGGGKVTVEILKEKNNIRLNVKDIGVGIPNRDKKYIFQKFFRSKNVLKYQTYGTGLGLFICQSIIRNFKGKMSFKSREGVGSTFSFTIPIKN